MNNFIFEYYDAMNYMNNLGHCIEVVIPVWFKFMKSIITTTFCSLRFTKVITNSYVTNNNI